MPNDITEKLRNEINDAKKMRHDFVLRKFALITTLLGIGVITTKEGHELLFDFSWLLYLVPLVAVAFDFYIVAEDYRIRRAGTFLRKSPCVDVTGEKDWETFVKRRPNITSTFAFGLVTIIYLTGASRALLELKRETEVEIYNVWFFSVLFIEVALMLWNIFLRYWISRAPVEIKNEKAPIFCKSKEGGKHAD